MSSASRAPRIPVVLYQAVGPAGKSGSKLRRASEISLTTPGLDLATRLRVFQRALRGRVERREALIDVVRGVNATLEPQTIAQVIVDRAATWVPAPCWADRKSTRLNSSHQIISYAVFCLKKKRAELLFASVASIHHAPRCLRGFRRSVSNGDTPLDGVHLDVLV